MKREIPPIILDLGGVVHKDTETEIDYINKDYSYEVKCKIIEIKPKE